MKKIAIVTDSTCDLPDKVIEKYGIKIIPLRVIYKNEEYRDRIDIQPQEVYERLTTEIPKSSISTPKDAYDVFDKLYDDGYTDVIVITISSGLSGEYNMLKMLSKDYKKLNVKVIDSKILSMGLGFLVIEGAKLIKQTDNIDIITKKIEEVRKKVSAFYIIKTLEYLKKGGRIGKVEGTVGEILNVKPIIGVNDDGVYYTHSKAIGRKKSINKMIEFIKDKYQGKKINLAVVHGAAEQDANKILQKIKSICNVSEEYIAQISPVLGLHTGPGLLGLITYEV